MTKSLDEIFAEEEARILAEHKAWLADPVAQAKHKAEVEARAARIDQAIYDDPDEEDDSSDDEDDWDDEEEGDQ